MIPFFIGNNLSYAQEVRVVETLYRGAEDVVNWCEALRTGNIAEIKKGLDDKILKQYHKLFNYNNGYSKYLKEHFKDARFEITFSEVIEGGVSFGVTIIMPPERGGRHPTTVYMQEAPSSIPEVEAKWKVASTKETFQIMSGPRR